MQLPTESKRILLIEEDSEVRRRIEAVLEGAGYQLAAPEAFALARDQLAERHFDAVIFSLGQADPRTRIREVKRRAAGTPLLVLCDPERVEAAVDSLQHGVEDYLLRPPDSLELKRRLGRILERHELDSRIAFFQNEISKRHGLKRLEVRSPAMRSVADQLLRVAPMRSTVMIYGESGVGKELVARAIHFNSPRAEGPFIALNCSAIPASLIESELFGHEKGAFTGAHARGRGKFEIANGGTIFLDEVAEMTMAAQVKLLRVLEEREFMRIGGNCSLRVDVRVLAATNAELEALVAESRFRRDLYYRLKVVTLRVPPLRERRADTPHLIASFIDELARSNAVAPKTVDRPALDALCGYAWPGNVRELKNLLESLLVSVTADVIRVEDLPAYVRGAPAGEPRPAATAGTTLADMERDLIRQTLEVTGGNRTHSAQMLGIGVRTLQRKIRGYDLKIPPTRRRPRRDRAG